MRKLNDADLTLTFLTCRLRCRIHSEKQYRETNVTRHHYKYTVSIDHHQVYYCKHRNSKNVTSC